MISDRAVHDRRVVEIVYVLATSAVMVAVPVLVVRTCARLFGWTFSSAASSIGWMLLVVLAVVVVVRAARALVGFELGLRREMASDPAGT